MQSDFRIRRIEVVFGWFAKFAGEFMAKLASIGTNVAD
jgi:hypothetical protein